VAAHEVVPGEMLRNACVIGSSSSSLSTAQLTDEAQQQQVQCLAAPMQQLQNREQVCLDSR
jgi:hypothetical protein